MPQPTLPEDHIATTSITSDKPGRLERRVGQGSAGSTQNARGFDSRATSGGNDRRDPVMSTLLSSVSVGVKRSSDVITREERNKLADGDFLESDEGEVLPAGKGVAADDDDAGVSSCNASPSEGAGVFSAGCDPPTPRTWRCRRENALGLIEAGDVSSSEGLMKTEGAANGGKVSTPADAELDDGPDRSTLGAVEQRVCAAKNGRSVGSAAPEAHRCSPFTSVFKTIPSASPSGTSRPDTTGRDSAVKSSPSPRDPSPVPAVSNPSSGSDRHRPTVKSGRIAAAPAVAYGSPTAGTVDTTNVGTNGLVSHPSLASAASITRSRGAERAGEGFRRDATVETEGGEDSVGEYTVAVPPRQDSPVLISDAAAAAACDRSPGEGSFTQTSTRSARECTASGAGVEGGEGTPPSSVILTPEKRQRRCLGTFFEDYSAVVAGNPRRVRGGDERAACGEPGIPRAALSSLKSMKKRAPDGRCPGLGCADSDSEASGENLDEASSGRRFLGSEVATSTTASNRQSGPGATLDPEHAARLAVLLYHVRDCPGDHSSPRLAEVCRSGKSLMLHLRGCSGRTSIGEPCPMPWCRPLASLLHRLIRRPVRCPKSAGGQVCPTDLARDS